MSTTIESEQLIFFGDSYSDEGLAYSLSAGVLAFPYPFDFLGYQQSFTNGDVWTEYAEALLGVEGISYAIGGAEADGSQTLMEYIDIRNLSGLLVVGPGDPALSYDINIDAQIERFLADNAGADLSDTGAWIFAGLNDYLNFILETEAPTLQEGTLLVEGVVQALLDQIQALALAGVGEIFISNLPDVNFLPYTATAPLPIKGLADFGIEYHNYLLELGIAALQDAGIEVTLIDLNSFSEEVIADPTSFGFVAPLEEYKVIGLGPGFVPVFNSDLDGLDEDQFAFWDAVHGTTALHGVIASYKSAAATHEVVEGSAGDDRLTGSGEADLIMASGGDDRVVAGGGDDIVLAGQGDDTVMAGEGDDIVMAGSGDDVVRAGGGNDVLAGGEGDDRLSGGDGNDLLIGGLGSDIASGGDGDDVFLFTDAVLIGGTAGTDHDRFDGGTGEDTLYLALAETSRETVESARALGASWEDALAEIDIELRDIESVVLLDSRLDLALVDSDARIAEADLWGIV